MLRAGIYLWIMIGSIMLCGGAEEDMSEMAKPVEIMEDSEIEAFSITREESDSIFQKEIVQTYELSMPDIVIKNAGGEKQIQKWYERERESFFQYQQAVYWMADDQYRDCLWAAKESGSMSWELPFEYNVSYEVGRMDEQYISLRKCEDIYMAGPHNNLTYTGIVLDAKTGDELQLEDILARYTDEQENARILLAEYLIEQLTGEEEYLFEGYEEKVEFIITYNPKFFIEEDKLIFIFNTYELASYVRGEIQVEVPLNVLSDLKNAVDDTETAYHWAQTIERPVSANGYRVHVFAGETIRADLDGDGVEEEILYPESGVDGCYVILSVNGKEFRFDIDENIVEEYIGLTDINVEDGKYELAVYAFGPSSDETTTFFRYDGSALQEIGRIEGIANRNNAGDIWDIHEEYGIFWNDHREGGETFLYKKSPRTSMNGRGSIWSQKRLNTGSQTLWVSAEWKLNPETDRIEFCESDYYDMYNPWCNRREENPYDLKGDIYLYEEDDPDAENCLIKGKGSRIVQFIKTDNKEWFYVEVLTCDGLLRGWIRKEDGWMICNPWAVD